VRVMYNMCTMIPALPVYLDVKTFEALGGEPEGTEQDMLDIAFEPYKTWKVCIPAYYDVLPFYSTK